MADSNENVYELNEVSWWSQWTEVVWFGRDAYALFSRDFDEYFFNRAGFLRVTAQSVSVLGEIEEEFRIRRITPHVFLQSDLFQPRLLQRFSKSGYRIADQMSVMEMERPSFSVNKDITLEMGNKERLNDWVEVYLRSFYEETELTSKITAIVARVSASRETSLLLASLEGKAVGALALYRSPELCGVYCVGTVPEMRGKHVASTMLDFACKLAANEKRKVILQTITSDSVESLYLRAGFRRVYLKDLFVKDAGHALKSKVINPA